ncbi:zinc-binding dehydrogenase [Thalassospira xiamenensis]|uniref:Dehydrogenase n=1 Tax=Thalassospira xiamenensis TaxID=220697 RepID=A0ABR5Y4U0_9PROT|nr:zinc-binding dehydrogenase [Thalassospira xiamenensis]KZD05695.1 dehydrogenase [Thalassospira xiamenensis]KZD09622.1 dehydrogenase [Thalassospira xiamenensis]MCD1595242.1 zinc-binding dehydrogenase [Thalassospira xiamenensis]
MDSYGTFKAAILVEQRQPLVIADLSLPEQLEVGQVLVKIHYSGICGSQLGEIDGAKGPDRWLPHLLGHEGSGVVLAVGPGVKHVSTGDKVVLHWRPGPGIEAAAPKYRWGEKTVNAGWITTFNEMAVVSENRLTRIPQDSNMEVAPLLGCAVTTGFGTVLNNAQLRIGESIVVFGAGGVGLNMVQAAAMTSGHPIIAVDVFDGRLELALQMGATHTINAQKVDVDARIKEILGDQDLDVFIDNTGKPEIIERGYALTGPKGRVVLVGVPKKGNDILIYSLPLHFGKIITGSHGGETIPDQDIPRYMRLFAEGKLRLAELLTETFTLDDINTAIQGMRDGMISGRCLIKM